MAPDVTEPQPRSENDPFNFTGVSIQTEIAHGKSELQGDEDNQMEPFMVSLSVLLPGEIGKPPPYKIDIRCVGYFTIPFVFADEARREDVAVVNGASVIYSAIRDMVSAVTARSWGRG